MLGINKLRKDISLLKEREHYNKYQIEKLQNDTRCLERKCDNYSREIELLKWKVDNPPAYKVGDKKDGGYVCKVDWTRSLDDCSCKFGYKWIYEIVKPNK